jgi:hypothetical protein
MQRVSLTDKTGETRHRRYSLTAHNPAHVSMERKCCPPIVSDRRACFNNFVALVTDALAAMPLQRNTLFESKVV